MNNGEINNRIHQSWLKRKNYIEQNKLEAFRMYEGEKEGLPVAIDCYKENAVIHIFAAIDSSTCESMERAVKKEWPIKQFFYKNRTRTKTDTAKESLGRGSIIEEYGKKFWINASDYLDTGLFLDHRETRAWIGKKSAGKSVLNTFAYTGSFSVYAAKGGAQKTHTVDLSKTYCDWTKKNFELNGIDTKNHWIYKMDTVEYLKYAQKKNLLFDIIIIDPPTFSRNKGCHFSVQKEHPELIKMALGILKKNGFILFSNNCRNFILNKKALQGMSIEEKKDTIPLDFKDKIPHRCFIIRH